MNIKGIAYNLLGLLVTLAVIAILTMLTQFVCPIGP